MSLHVSQAHMYQEDIVPLYWSRAEDVSESYVMCKGCSASPLSCS